MATKTSDKLINTNSHVEQKCMNKNKNANVSSIKLDSFYVLTKGTNGVHARSSLW